MREALVPERNPVGRCPHKGNRFAMRLCQPAAERQCLPIDVQANSLGRVVTLEKSERLPRPAADIQNCRLGPQSRATQKTFPKWACASLCRLQRELGAMIGQVTAQGCQPGAAVTPPRSTAAGFASYPRRPGHKLLRLQFEGGSGADRLSRSEGQQPRFCVSNKAIGPGENGIDARMVLGQEIRDPAAQNSESSSTIATPSDALVPLHRAPAVGAGEPFGKLR